jgi:hypothetical protein
VFWETEIEELSCDYVEPPSTLRYRIKTGALNVDQYVVEGKVRQSRRRLSAKLSERRSVRSHYHARKFGGHHASTSSRLKLKPSPESL